MAGRDCEDMFDRAMQAVMTTNHSPKRRGLRRETTNRFA